ncbi:unannotated protein [freshwater metagenome]|uniref:Unannotated protein n=1 Tax=freshwater metagenome TaxID=449393 RepID=A0A6J5ZW20_9ZZZZ
MLKGARVRADAGRVHASLVRESVLSDIRLSWVGRTVQELVDEMRRLGEPSKPPLRKDRDSHLHFKVGDDRDEVGVAGPFPYAVDCALNLCRAGLYRDERIGDRAASVVMGVNPDCDFWQRFADCRHRSRDLTGQ